MSEHESFMILNWYRKRFSTSKASRTHSFGLLGCRIFCWLVKEMCVKKEKYEEEAERKECFVVRTGIYSLYLATFSFFNDSMVDCALCCPDRRLGVAADNVNLTIDQPKVRKAKEGTRERRAKAVYRMEAAAVFGGAH
jgi:hypothetical protein